MGITLIMAKALFIAPIDLKRYSSMSGNIDDDKLNFHIEEAMDIHIQRSTGTDLFNRLKAGVIADDLSADETSLINTYIKPMTIYWTLVELFSTIPYTINNKGVFKHTSENAETVSKEEVGEMVARFRDKAQYYTRRFDDYMCFNSNTFPEYDTNSDEDIDPSRTSNFGGWQL